MKTIKSLFSWLNKNLSADSTTSNSRTLQTLIVLNLIVMCWLVLVHANWTISDNLRLVLLCLITGGAGGYIANKLSGGGGS